MKELLPVGKLRVYQLQNVLNPESWFRNHSRHNWEFHLENLKKLGILLPASCYVGKKDGQHILCQILEDGSVAIHGDLVISRTKVLTLSNILYDIEEGKIRATVENPVEESQEVYFYSSADSSWKSRLPQVRKDPFQLEMVRLKTQIAQLSNESDRALQETAARREYFQNFLQEHSHIENLG
jgi:hypothetical protein